MMNTDRKASRLKVSLEFLLHERLTNQAKNEKLYDLNMKIQSAIAYDLEVFRNERKKELDKLYKTSNEEFIENSALRISKNSSNAEYSHNTRFDNTELWRIQKYSQNSESKPDSTKIKAKSKKREGLIASTNKRIHFDRETYDKQMNQLKDCPEKLEFLRTSHVPSEDDKKLLINQYIKNHRRKSISESLDVDSDIYHINQENKKYNEKLDRAYNEYSTEIKQNLERGTAL